MKIAVIGATGKAGSRIVAELLGRGHSVTAIARNPQSLPSRPGLQPRAVDARDATALVPVLAGHDAVVTAMRFLQIDPAALIASAKAAGVARFLVVGGAGTLVTASGAEALDTPLVPPFAREESLAGRAFLGLLRREDALPWTFLSPSVTFAPGARTGKFRLGLDELLVGADGTSAISMEDYAIAMADEIERPRHPRRRFTVGY